jgi:hypothetical protein
MQEVEMEEDDRQLIDDESEWWNHQDERSITIEYSDGYEMNVLGVYEWDEVAK